MENLLSLRHNVFYAKEKNDKKEEYIPFIEMVFITEKPNYKLTNERGLIRERTVDEHRFIIPNECIDSLINELQAIKEKHL
nr:hypothetical protein [uncultured Flavobacterium sp.]